MRLLTPRYRWDVCSIAEQLSPAKPDLCKPKVQESAQTFN